MHAPVRAPPSPRPQQKSEETARQGKTEHRKTDKTLVLKRILPMGAVGAESRVCQSRMYGELPMKMTAKEKEHGNSRYCHLR